MSLKILTKEPFRDITIIEARSGWQLIDWHELWRYRDLFYFLVWRDIKTRYAQSILGVGWAVIQPIFSMIVFTIVFGNLAKISSDGVPYSIFSYTALVPWTYFSSALTGASSSLSSAKGMITKSLFPALSDSHRAGVGQVGRFWDCDADPVCLNALVWYSAHDLGLERSSASIADDAHRRWAWHVANRLVLSVQYRDINYAMSFVS